MSARGWILAYRAAVRLLPRTLRDKHGAAMTALYARELAAPDAGSAVALAGLADVVRRATYERTRPLVSLARRTAVSFLVAFAALTALTLANYALRRSTVSLQFVVLALPFTAAMTIPLAVFISALWSARALRRESRTGAVPAGIMRALVVLGALVALGTFGVAAELTPRANARLQTIMAGRPVPRTDRAMTIPELRAAAAQVRVAVMPPSAVQPSTVGPATVWSARAAEERRANYAVEIHKKFVIAGACLVLVLAGFAIGWRLPNSGAVGLVVVSVAVFSLYLVGLMAGKSLADQLILPPWAAMWLVNVVGMMGVLLVLPRGATPEAYAPSTS